jgi:hypothetical protein
MDFVGELTYPVGESISDGIIMTSSQIGGILLILLASYLIENVKPLLLTNLIYGLCLLVSFISLFFLEEKLLKTQTDEETE